MEEVVKAGHRATVLTKQLLAFSRKQILQPTAFDLSALVTGMRPMLSRLITAAQRRTW
jgi:two-component system, cell cycle sensor histidine kinase and response regulator CckA